MILAHGLFDCHELIDLAGLVSLMSFHLSDERSLQIISIRAMQIVDRLS
jgi:hypothetical protein